MNGPGRWACGTAGPMTPIRGRIIAVIVLVLVFPFVALGWFEPAQVVVLLTAIAAVITALMVPVRQFA